MSRGTSSSHLTLRDGELLCALARMRVLSFRQLTRLVFHDTFRSVADRRIRKLARRGWVSVWEEPVVRGGHPHYALPTRGGLARAFDELVASSTASLAERIVALMARAPQRRPLALQPGAPPAFLAHQREVNHLLISFERCPAFRVLWASSWDRPFPTGDNGLPLPQPDYVALFEHPAGPRLVFGEHDRGQESLAHFKTAKVDRYAALAAMPEVCQRLFGFASFETWVTVIDTRFRHPVRRVRELARVATAGGAAGVMRFSLGGWVFDAPAESIWFRDAAWTEGETVRRQDHIDLLPAFELEAGVGNRHAETREGLEGVPAESRAVSPRTDPNAR